MMGTDWPLANTEATEALSVSATSADRDWLGNGGLFTRQGTLL